MRQVRSLRCEWTKLRTLPSTFWLLFLAVAGTAGLGYAIVGSFQYAHCDFPCTPDLTKLSLAGVRLGQVGVLILAILAVTSEYSSRTILPTVTAVPRRIFVVLGKVGVLAVLGLLTGAVSVGASLLAARMVLPGNGFTSARGFASLSLDDALTRRAAIGTILYMGLIALLGAGLGLLLRDTAGTLTVALTTIYGAPVVGTFVTNPRWQHRIHRFSPMDAGLAIQATRNFGAEHIGPWAGVGVLSAYAAAAVLAGLLVFQLRDTR
jgi:ABC-2 type transport system permease protein